MVEKPYVVYLLGFCFILFLFSISLRITEEGFAEVAQIEFGYYNCLIGVFMTMTTVGYGDIFPGSELGRFLLILACIMGIFLISMVLIVINNALVLNINETFINKVLNNINTNDEKEQRSKRVVNDFFRLSIGLKKKVFDNKKQVVKSIRDKLLLNIFELKEQKYFKKMENPASREEIVFYHCEKLEYKIKTIKDQTTNIKIEAMKLFDSILAKKLVNVS